MKFKYVCELLPEPNEMCQVMCHDGENFDGDTMFLHVINGELVWVDFGEGAISRRKTAHRLDKWESLGCYSGV